MSVGIHFYEYNKNYYAINPDEMTVQVISKGIYNELSSTNFNHSKNNDEKNEIYKEYGLIRNEIKRNKTIKDIEKSEVPLSGIALFITQECNLKCTYCYGDGGNYGTNGAMKLDVALKAIDWLIAQSKDKRKLTVSFFGGEPLMNFPLLKDIVNYSVKRGIETDKEFSFNITTNASLFNKEIIDFIKQYSIKPLISIDGPEEIHNRQRPYRDGIGSFMDVIAKTKMVLNEIPEAECRATLLDDAEPVKIDNFLHEIGFNSTSLLVASESLFNVNKGGASIISENGIYSKMSERFDIEAKNFIKAIDEQNIDEIKRIKGSGLFINIIESFFNKHKKLFPCGAGRTSVAVSITGDIFLCHRFVGSEEYMIGNIYNPILNNKIYQTSPILLNDKCSDCFARYVCAGGCYHNNLGKNGAINKVDTDTCEVIKHAVEVSASLYCSLDNNDIEFLRSESILEKELCPFDLY